MSSLSQQLFVAVVLFSVAVTAACGFDWSLPAADGEGGAGGADGTTQAATTGSPGDQAATTGTSTNATCESCAEEATQGECAQQTEACLQTAGCKELSECAFGCPADPACVDGCLANTSDEAVLAFTAVADCIVCAKCVELCQEYAEVCTL